MVLANLLLCISMTVFIPSMPHWLLYEEGFSTEETGLAMGVFALGLFLPGAFCSYLVQHFRRNMVCVWAVTLLAVSMMAPLYLPVKGMLWVAIALRLVQGMAFGLAQMVLTSTLIIDTCESFQRTEANHSVTWFGRFALSLGPLLGLLLLQQQGFTWVLWASAGCCVLAMLLILSVHFPFRVPTEKIHALSLDRFLLVSGWPLMLHLFLVTLAVGMLLSLRLDMHFYGLMMVGFLLALLAQRYMFPDADLKSEVVSGLILIGASLLILLKSPSSVLLSPLLGVGIGLVGSRFLLFFVKLSHHCQRGTSQSTFMLGWESGLAVGIGLGYSLFAGNTPTLIYVALTIIALVLCSYVFFMHDWFIHHKSR